jgi:superfamily II DNA or RNA helicase
MSSPSASSPPQPLWSVSIAGRVAPWLRERGQEYFQRGAVRLLRANRTEVDAQVHGDAVYRVHIEARSGGLQVTCSCPYNLRQAGACKHIWAAILAAESEGHLGAAAPDPRAHLRAAWRRQVASLLTHAGHEHTQLWPAQREVLYVIDTQTAPLDDGLRLELRQRERKRDGGWKPARTLRLTAEEVAGLPEAVDRRILTALAGVDRVDDWRSATSATRRWPTLFRLSGTGLRELLPQVLATGRGFMLDDRGQLSSTPLVWDDGPAWELRLRVAPGTTDYVLGAVLQRGDEIRALTEPTALLGDGIVIFPDRAALLDHGGHFAWIVHLREEAQISVPREDGEALIQTLLKSPRRFKVDLPDELRYEEREHAPRPVLAIGSSDPAWERQGRVAAALRFDYEGTRVGGDDHRWALPGRTPRELLLRDRGAEQRARVRLHDAGARALDDDSGFEIRKTALPQLTRRLLEEGWLVEAEGRRLYAPLHTRLAVRSSIDWFDLDGDVDFGSQRVPIKEILTLLASGATSVPLGDGEAGVLPPEWIERYGLLARFATDKKGTLRFKHSQAALLDALLAGQPDVELDAAFTEARSRLARFEGLVQVEPPASFQGTLRGYQREGLGWLRFLQNAGLGGCLADDMGLGKTVQVLALLAARAEELGASKRASLVVVPRSLVFNWKQEAARFAPKLRILDLTGPDRPKRAAALSGQDVVLTTYGTLRQDAIWLKDVRFDYAILDEAQTIKNASTASAKAARLLQADHRLALSGTPIENHLGELWSLFEFLNPGLLGRATALADDVTPAGRALLARALRPYILRRTKEQVAADLPAKTEQVLQCELSADHRKFYDGLREAYRASLLGRLETDGLGRSKMHVLEALLRLRQAACHPGLVDKKRVDEESAKFEVLLPKLREVLEEGHKALVFSQFTSLLALLRRSLDAAGIVYEYLDGHTRDREAHVARFQEDKDCGLFLISLKAGGLGLNLTAAEYVFLLDPWWNPAAEAQAIDRAHRIGQSRPVFAYRLIAKDTIEEKVMQLQDSKRDLANAILSADGSLISKLQREDLELLLS